MYVSALTGAFRCATRYSYSIFDLAVALVVMGTLVSVLRHAVTMAVEPSRMVTAGEQDTSRTL